MLDFIFSETEELDFDTGPDEEIDVDVGEVTKEVTSDYRQLINRPSINGTSLLENYDEIDPTVPMWAKRTRKPKYTAKEIGALDANSEVSFSDIKELWDSIFKEEM